MTTEQIAKLVVAANGFYENSDDEIPAKLCTAIEVLMKQLEKCVEQRDSMAQNYYLSEYGLAGTMIAKYNQELDMIGRESQCC